jgi:hypothetical protein
MKSNSKLFYNTLFLLYTLASCQSGNAILSVPSEIDLGVIAVGDSVLKNIPIVNTGNKALEIKQIKTSCSCLVSSYSGVVNPNDTGEVSVKFRSFRTGQFKQLVMLETNSIPVLRTIKVIGYVH